jgi:hypothetical protein
MRMNITKLNRLAIAYKLNPSDDSFSELYHEAKHIFDKVNRGRLVRSGWGDESDADGVFNAVILKLSREPDVLDFTKAMSTALKNATINFIKSAKSYRKRNALTIDITNHDEDAPTSDVVDNYNLEEDVLSQLRKKEDDQRQLIVSLIDPAKVDNDTTLIVSQFPQHDSITALAKALGMHHEFVKRKLRKLSRGYDANRFGDVNEYLAV